MCISCSCCFVQIHALILFPSFLCGSSSLWWTFDREHVGFSCSQFPVRSELIGEKTRLPLAAVRGRSLGLVLENVLDPGHDLWGDLWQQLHGFAVVLDLCDLGGSQNHSADVGVHNAPVSGI